MPTLPEIGQSDLTPRDLARFWPKVDRSGGPDACWPWMAATDHKGYGQFGLAVRWKPERYQTKAHRVAWIITHGPIPDGMFALHRCDNPPCCNPAHLFLGTKRDNVRDAVAKGRHPMGERHHQAKLTEAQVLMIRARHAAGGVSCTALAREHGVSRSLVSMIVGRTVWRHLAA